MGVLGELYESSHMQQQPSKVAMETSCYKGMAICTYKKFHVSWKKIVQVSLLVFKYDGL